MKGARWRGVLACTGTVVLVAWLVRALDPALLAELWAGRQPAELALAFAAYFAVHVFRALRYHVVGARLGGGSLLAIAVLHGFSNRVLPMRMGEVAYGYLVKRFGGASFSVGMLGLVQIRLVDLCIVAGVYGTFLVQRVGGQTNAGGLPLLAAAVALLAAIAYVAIGPALGLGVRWLGRIEAVVGPRPALASASKLVGELRAYLATITARSRVTLVLATVGVWLASYVSYWAILRGFSVALPFGTVVLGSSFANLASVLPVSLVGSFGALEAGWAAGFMLVGVEGDLAAATGVVFSATTLAFSATMAAIALVVAWPRTAPSSAGAGE